MYSGREILSGTLRCEQCGHKYPVTHGVPRLLPEQLSKIVADTQHSFGFQWNRFSSISELDKSNFDFYLNNPPVSLFSGKLGLDVGCGYGRHLYTAASYGAEMIGMDLSEAVKAAYRNTRHLPRVHIIQADLYYPPFRQKTFDFAYCIGVLHHLPDPITGFASIMPVVKRGGEWRIWVYRHYNRFNYFPLFSMLRAITLRLPLRFLYALCLPLAVLEKSLILWPYGLLKRFKQTEQLASVFPFKYHIGASLRTCWADWFDNLSVPVYRTYTRDEVVDWFARYPELEVTIPKDDWNGHILGIRKEFHSSIAFTEYGVISE
jgi:SAM-dependent methyltransferase